MEAYMKLVGEKYLQDTLSEFTKTVLETQDDCEVGIDIWILYTEKINLCDRFHKRQMKLIKIHCKCVYIGLACFVKMLFWCGGGGW